MYIVLESRETSLKKQRPNLGIGFTQRYEWLTLAGSNSILYDIYLHTCEIHLIEVLKITAHMLVFFRLKPIM